MADLVFRDDAVVMRDPAGADKPEIPFV